MLFSSSLVLTVAEKDTDKDMSPERITLFSVEEEAKIICSSSPFSSPIRMAKLNKKRIVVFESDFIHVYVNPGMELIHTIEAPELDQDKIALSSSEENCYLCYCPDSSEGFVKIFNLITLSYEIKIRAHRTAVNKIAICQEGIRLATCSEKGTVIRVFNLQTGDKISTFKRGMSYCDVFGLSFSSDFERLVLSSDTNTFHVFNIKTLKENGVVGSFFQKMLPREYEDSVAERAEISCKQTEIKDKNIAFFRQKYSNQVCLFGEDGQLAVFELDFKEKEAKMLTSTDLKRKLVVE